MRCWVWPFSGLAWSGSGARKRTVHHASCPTDGGITVNYDRDLLRLYKRVYQKLNLDPGAEDLETTLRRVLGGLIGVVGGLSGIRNRMSDAHTRSCRAGRRHAILAVNAANTFVDFILENYKYQQD